MSKNSEKATDREIKLLRDDIADLRTDIAALMGEIKKINNVVGIIRKKVGIDMMATKISDFVMSSGIMNLLKGKGGNDGRSDDKTSDE